jgi:RNA-binding protein
MGEHEGRDRYARETRGERSRRVNEISDTLDEKRSGLAGFQRRFLRGQANPLQPLVQVGEAGLSDGVVRALDAALADHELVKVRLHAPPDKHALAAALAERAHAELCGVVGHTVILFRRNPARPRIRIPERR